ncbi:hypothetical protein [Dyadobacter sp. CY351]|uniref:hypothetical protein n=1 Tax=Dyadobacter sp. CY351 TaxID=2909337 RepID=UPI001F1856FB|nr:hypothetical protein [Dyadobacter sp. CY351]MCF2520883.1 hypothetical protein [Dyadobacter sp. CY351]
MKTLGILICIIGMSLTSCNEQSVSGQDLIKNEIPCNLNNEVRREVTSENGVIEYRKTLDKYFIKVVPAGHIDTVIFGSVCNLPEELKLNNLKVTFSGQYFEQPEKMPTTFVGHEYYDLNLTAYKVTEPN